MIAPIISGAMSEHVGWRNFWWLNVALLALGFLMVLFMFPETKWHRVHPSELDQNSMGSNHASNHASNEKADIGGVGQGKTVHDTTTTNLEHINTVDSPKPENQLEGTHTAERDPWLNRGGPSKKQWGLFTPNPTPVKSIILDLWIPWKLFAFPIVEFASFVVSWSCSSFLTLNLTQTQAFAAPPYLWTTQSIGKRPAKHCCSSHPY